MCDLWAKSYRIRWLYNKCMFRFELSIVWNVVHTWHEFLKMARGYLFWACGPVLAEEKWLLLRLSRLTLHHRSRWLSEFLLAGCYSAQGANHIFIGRLFCLVTILNFHLLPHSSIHLVSFWSSQKFNRNASISETMSKIWFWYCIVIISCWLL